VLIGVELLQRGCAGSPRSRESPRGVAVDGEEGGRGGDEVVDEVQEQVLAPLSAAERRRLEKLLRKLLA
jgi:hypothetical protein